MPIGKKNREPNEIWTLERHQILEKPTMTHFNGYKINQKILNFLPRLVQKKIYSVSTKSPRKNQALWISRQIWIIFRTNLECGSGDHVGYFKWKSRVKNITLYRNHFTKLDLLENGINGLGLLDVHMKLDYIFFTYTRPSKSTQCTLITYSPTFRVKTASDDICFPLQYCNFHFPLHLLPLALKLIRICSHFSNFVLHKSIALLK